VLGDPRTNQNPGVLALAILLYRWHNYQAMLVKKNQPDWVDEDIFQAARRRVIATLQVQGSLVLLVTRNLVQEPVLREKQPSLLL
jgi:Animal haem peroxidase